MQLKMNNSSTKIIGYVKFSYNWCESLNVKAQAIQTLYIYWDDINQHWLEKSSYSVNCNPKYKDIMTEFIVKTGIVLENTRAFCYGEEKTITTPQSLAQNIIYVCGSCQVEVCMYNFGFIYNFNTTDSLRKFIQQDFSDLVVKVTLHNLNIWKLSLWKYAFSRRFIVEDILQIGFTRLCVCIARNFETLTEYYIFLRSNLRCMHIDYTSDFIRYGRMVFIIKKYMRLMI
jgi:hypothetical protein